MTAGRLSQAQLLESAIQERGEYSHVSVRNERKALYIYAGDSDPVAKLTEVGSGNYGLHFHSHTGRWETMPIIGKIPAIAETIVDTLGPHLEAWG
jgi:hypothetical protein